jgi:tetratricopeptide (TPR) repeat protein
LAEVKINRNRLIKLLVLACVLGVLCGGFYAYRVHQIRAGFLTMRDQGLKAADSGQGAVAVNLLGGYLARYPNDTGVLTVYARQCVLLEDSDSDSLSRAIWALRHLLRLEPSRLDAREQLMGLYVKTGYHAEALDEANTIITARIDSTGDPSTTLQLTALELNVGSSDHALTEAEIKAIEPKILSTFKNYPDAREAAGVRTTSLLQLHEYSKALVPCQWWIKADPTSLDAALVNVELMQDNHRSREEASKFVENWCNAHTDATENGLLRGHTDLAFGQIRKAIDELAVVANNNHDPDSAMAQRTLVGDLDAIRQPALARKVLGRLLAKTPKDASLRFNLIGRDWDSGHLADVIDLTSSLESGPSTPTYILGLRTTALMLLGRIPDSKQSLQALADRKDDREAAGWLTVIQQSIDHHPDSTQTVKACLAALDQNSRDYYLRHFLASTYAQMGENDQAIHEWQRVVNEDISWPVPAIRLSKCLLDSGRTEQALDVALEATRRSEDKSPEAAEASLLRAEAWIANIQAGHKENADELLTALSRTYEQHPHDASTIVLNASLLAALGNIPEATKIVRDALAAPDQLPEQSWIRLATICASKQLGDHDQPSLQRACLDRSQKEHGISASLAYAKAVTESNPKAGLASLNADAEAFAKQPPSTQPLLNSDGVPVDGSLGWDLARAEYLELNHDPAAAAAWAKLADRNPSQLRIQRLVLSVQSVRADKDLSRRCIERIGNICGVQDFGWRSARARWLVSFTPLLDSNRQPTPEAVEARNLLNDLVAQAPDSLENRLISAQAFELIGKLPDAINELRFATNLNPGLVSIRLYLARLLEKEGDFDGVTEQLDRLSDLDLLGTDQRRQAAAILAEQGQMERAIKLLEEDSNTNKESDTASLLLAQLYQRRGDLPNAQTRVDKLLATHPDAAVVRFAADLYASKAEQESSTKPDLAKADLDKAHSILDRLGQDVKAEPGVPELIRATFCFMHERAAGPDRAISLFEAATKAAPTNPLTWRSLTAINLFENRPDSALAAANAGLRAIPNEPALQAISNHDRKMLKYAASKPELLPLLSYFVNNPSAGSVAAETLDEIYSNFKNQKPLDSLAGGLRELATKNPRCLPLQVYLINLLYRPDRLGNVEDAIPVAFAAERALPDAPQIAELTTQVLLAANRYPEALAAAQHWYEISPTQRPQAILAEADAYQALKRPKDALDILKPLVEAYANAGDTNAYLAISQQYASVLSDEGTKPALAALMQPLLQRTGRDAALGRLQYMKFAVANLTAADAEAWLKTASDKMPPPDSPDHILERVELSEMYSKLALKSGDPAYAQTARDILNKLAAAPNPPLAVFLALGTRLDSDGNAAAAVSVYQHALAIAPGNVIAQNNLAMAMARTGHAAEALQYIDDALKAMPETPELYDTRAFVRSKAGQTDAAIADMREAIRLNPAQPRFRLKLIQTLTDANRRKDAADELKALDAMPSTLSPQQAQQLKDLHARLAIAILAPGT